MLTLLMPLQGCGMEVSFRRVAPKSPTVSIMLAQSWRPYFSKDVAEITDDLCWAKGSP